MQNSPACHFHRLNLTPLEITYGFPLQSRQTGDIASSFTIKKKKKIEKFWFKCLVCIRRVHLGRRILSLKIKSNLEQSK